MIRATLCFLVRGTPPREVLLGYKKRGFGAQKYNGFGGKVEAGETVSEAAARELEEEAGVRVRESDLRQAAHLTFTFSAEPGWDQIVHVFLADEWQGTPLESREMRPAWFAMDDLPFEHMWQDDAHWLPRVLSGERVRAWFAFGEDNETVVALEVNPWDGTNREGGEQHASNP
jgi:8-oxo-dGTP diphosphatase